MAAPDTNTRDLFEAFLIANDARACADAFDALRLHARLASPFDTFISSSDSDSTTETETETETETDDNLLPYSLNALEAAIAPRLSFKQKRIFSILGAAVARASRVAETGATLVSGGGGGDRAAVARIVVSGAGPCGLR